MTDSRDRGASELRSVMRAQRQALLLVVVFSVAVNLLLLTGPLYMLQIYDRVLGSRSEATLVALTVLMSALFLAMGLLDHSRSRILARIGADIQKRLDGRVFSAAMRRLAVTPDDAICQSAQHDVAAIQRFWDSPVAVSLLDLPWTPIFLAAIFVFHPSLGLLAVAGGAVIVTVALLNQIRSKRSLNRSTAAGQQADRVADLLKTEAETVRAMGMSAAAYDRWRSARELALAEGLLASDIGGGFSTISRTFRQFLRSAVLGLGAWLVLQDELTAGAMIAASILMGRALMPVEQAVAQWAVVTRARAAHARLSELLGTIPPEPPRTALPRPKGRMDVSNLTVVPPGEALPTVKMVAFSLSPGQALGVIGPSGAGKSTLARVLTGVWRPTIGTVRLDGAALDQYDAEILGASVGYLSQRVALFDGTVAENIARLSKPDATAVVTAAKAAAAHDMILGLPQGYDTRLSAQSGRLSGGQMQRIALARALYGGPALLVLDEPNSNLDNEGSQALNEAIRAHKAAGGVTVIMAHRPAAIQECEMLLVLEQGTQRAFGPRDKVLREMVQNHSEIVHARRTGSVA